MYYLSLFVFCFELFFVCVIVLLCMFYCVFLFNVLCSFLLIHTTPKKKQKSTNKLKAQHKTQTQTHTHTHKNKQQLILKTNDKTQKKHNKTTIKKHIKNIENNILLFVVI